MTTDLQAFLTAARDASDIVFLGGAGVSTESGIPDFRSASGLYSGSGIGGIKPEQLLHIDYLRREPEAFYRYYRHNMLYPDAQSNRAHRALAALEQAGKVRAVVTQNIDGLHQAAGSKCVLELHGSVLRNYCLSCGRKYGLGFVLSGEGAPKCLSCGGMVRPDVTLYGEQLDGDVLWKAAEAVRACDLLIAGGTSLTVYPAAGLPQYRNKGALFAIANLSETPLDGTAGYVLRIPVGEVLEGMV